MYIRQTVEAGGIPYEEYAYPGEEIEPADVDDLFFIGEEDGEESKIPSMPKHGAYWDGYVQGLRNYYLRLRGETLETQL